MKTTFLIGLVLLFGPVTLAQGDKSRFEIAADYSHFRLSPQSNELTGLGAFSLNGGGGALTYFLSGSIGIKGEFDGYGSTSKVFPNGATVSGNLYTYAAGPEFKLRSGKYQPFGQVLFGGAHSDAYQNICTREQCFGLAPTNAFDLNFGAGLDVKVARSIAIRAAEVDYVWTRFDKIFTAGSNNQWSLRLQAGVVFSF